MGGNFFIVILNTLVCTLYTLLNLSSHKRMRFQQLLKAISRTVSQVSAALKLTNKYIYIHIMAVKKIANKINLIVTIWKLRQCIKVKENISKYLYSIFNKILWYKYFVYWCNFIVHCHQLYRILVNVPRFRARLRIVIIN